MDLDFDLDFDFDDSLARGLSCYVRLVTEALGLRGDSSFVEAQRPANAYVALDGQLPDFPDHDVALLWDERNGWAAAIESTGGSTLVVVARLEQDRLPPPPTVVRWVMSLFRQDEGATTAFVPAPRTRGAAD
ncbi:hypothetical protein FKR81_28445 [Lentzea tibetensis]|uniref:DUF6292 domain-containing protein n=1 Tax=Lentzea tibetensis TaxID=2591470 RepID=A0A563EMV2_9PSEU|nr:DUF6292 family protein [Lentzea tibetensis]TWP48516.1 hypothetical protein FKR81_28445 [Lentzea tibetensis]